MLQKMWVAALMMMGAIAGLRLRHVSDHRYSLLNRGHLLLMVLPLTVLGGWLLRLQVSDGLAVVLLLLGEAIAGLLAWLWLRRDRGPEAVGLAFGVALNTGRWALPVAATFGPTAVAMVVLYDAGVGLLRSPLLVGMMRRFAPLPQSRVSGLADYAPPLGLLVGVGLAQLAPAPAWAPAVMQVLALALALVGFALLSGAWPRQMSGWCWEGLGMALMRLPVIAAPLLVASQLGLSIPAAAWVLALAPSWYAFLGFSRMYGYDTRLAATLCASSTLLAIAMLPLLHALL